MGLRALGRREVGRIWGRRELPPPFAGARREEPVGEVWFEDEAEAELLVKYLFTSDRLSVQVHPGDAAARARGYPRGKDEAWLVLDAEPGATIGLGLTRAIGREALRAAALDGSIEELLDWRPVTAGEVIYSPAGTIHAIGAGLTLIEIQQNLDLTYRLYDYGRPRELHVEDAVAVAEPGPFRHGSAPRPLGEGRELAAAGPAFSVERWRGPVAGRIAGGEELLIVPLAGTASSGDTALEPGSVWRLDGEAGFEAGADADLLVAYSGSVREALLG